MTTLILIRHAQSAANEKDVFAGHSHYPLTSLGRKQAELAAKYVAENFKIDKLYSSDLLRAYETACAVSEKLSMMPIHTDIGLREIYAGDWEGLTFSEMPVKFPEEYNTWMNDIKNCRCPNGESIQELFCRTNEALRNIARENDGKTVAVVYHSTHLRSLIAYVRDGDLSNLGTTKWPSNASVSVVKCDGESFEFELCDYAEHLKELKSKDLVL